MQRKFNKQKCKGLQKLHANNKYKRNLYAKWKIKEKTCTCYISCVQSENSIQNKSISFETNQPPLPQNNYIEKKGTNCAQNN